MDIILIFIIALALAIIYESAKVVFKFKGNLKAKLIAYKEYWLYSEGHTKILKSHLKLYLVCLLLTAASLIVGRAFSADWRILDGGSVIIGVQGSNTKSVFCVEKGINNKDNSNFTWNQNILSKRGTLWGRPIQFVSGINYTHHSCKANPDAVGYDKYGPFVGLIY